MTAEIFAWTTTHDYALNARTYIVAAHYYDYTYCICTEEVARFGTLDEAVTYVMDAYKYGRLEEIYEDSTLYESIDVPSSMNLEIYINGIDEKGWNAIATGVSHGVF